MSNTIYYLGACLGALAGFILGCTWEQASREAKENKERKAMLERIRQQPIVCRTQDDIPHIEITLNPTFDIDAFDCFMEQAFGLKRAKSGSETAPNTVSPNGSPVLGDNTNGIKPGSVTNQPKTTDWKPRKPRLNATRILV